MKGVYLRAKSEEGIEEQKKQLIDYIGCTDDIKVYTDFNELLNDINEGLIDYLYMRDPSRISRKSSEFFAFMKTTKTKGLEVVFIECKENVLDRIYESVGGIS